MKSILPSSAYTFSASAKQINVSAATGFDIRRLLAVINVKTGETIYGQGLGEAKYASFASNIITLQYDTTSMSDSDPLAVHYDRAEAGTLTNRSGSIAVGGLAQQLMPANPMRVAGFVQNESVASLWISDLGDAAPASPSIELPSGAFLDLAAIGVPTAELSIFGATALQAFTARER